MRKSVWILHPGMLKNNHNVYKNGFYCTCIMMCENVDEYIKIDNFI